MMEKAVMSVPLWKKEDLGKPLPDSPYAVSVCLPLWDHVIGYEEGRKDVVDAMTCGYPRFRYHSVYQRLCDELARSHARVHESVLALPSETVAQKCIDFVGAGRIEATAKDVVLAIVPQELSGIAKSFWQHTGLIVSPRQAEKALSGAAPSDGNAAKQAIRDTVASLTAQRREDVYLFAMGMGAIFTGYEAIAATRGSKILQLGFPYVDTLKIVEKFGAGGRYIPYNAPADLEKVRSALAGGDVSAVFCEIPGNPLLHTIDLPALSTMLRHYGVPLVIDDTIGTAVNIDVTSYADMITTSLTKFFSGEGDVTGGSLIVNSRSPYYEALKTVVDGSYEDLLYPDDAIVLAHNSRKFSARMSVIDANGDVLADYLSGHPKVDRVYYPKLIDREAYDAIRKPEGGYGGLLSFTLKDRVHAPAVYDRLEVSKGPSLGANFTLACPYTLLAHYRELAFAAENGIAPELIRVSAGMEDIKDLLGRFAGALG